MAWMMRMGHRAFESRPPEVSLIQRRGVCTIFIHTFTLFGERLTRGLAQRPGRVSTRRAKTTPSRRVARRAERGPPPQFPEPIISGLCL